MRQYSAMQELYDALFAYCQRKLHIDTYDMLPGNVPYPFVVLDSTQTITDAYKVGKVPTEIITLQVFAEREQRKDLNLFLESINDLRKVATRHFAYFALPDQNDVNMIEEQDGNDNLLHATISLHFVAYQQGERNVTR